MMQVYSLLSTFNFQINDFRLSIPLEMPYFLDFSWKHAPFSPE